MKRLPILISAIVLSGTLFAQETPLWIRKSSISPDGESIAFSYKGDIFTVPTSGGRALQITSNSAYDSDPMWTADGKQIVFSSYREKSKDIYVTGANGGTPKRLTFHPGNETPMAVLKDGKIIFAASIEQDIRYDGFPGTAQLYFTDLNGARPSHITSLPISAISISEGGSVIYEDWKGYEDSMRKHHTSAVTKDIWLYKSNDGNPLSINAEGTFKKLSDYIGEDRNPIFDSNGDTFYYLSERDGKAMNIYRSSISSPEKSEQLTFETRNPVRYLSISNNGTLAYSYNGELYTLKNGGKPEKVNITVYSDQDERDIEKISLRGGASAIAVPKSQKEIALVLRGDIFVTSIEHNTTKRITNTASQERNVSFSEDGRTLYYSAERDGNWGIWKTSLTDKNDKLFTYAKDFKEELFSDKGETCFQPVVSPDGKYVAYLRDRTELVIKPTKGGETISLLKGANYSYTDGDISFAWSPDSRYLLSTYHADGGWNNANIALVNIETKEVTDLTQSGYSDGVFRWALGGKAMTWRSDKDGYRSHGSWGSEDDIYIMFFDGKTMKKFNMDKEDEELEKLLSGDSEKKIKKEEKKDSVKKETKVEKFNPDLENRAERIMRLTAGSGRLGDYYLTEDGKKLYYVVRLESGYDLCVRDMKTRSVKVLKKGFGGSMVPSHDGKYLYASTGSGITRIGTAAGDMKLISFAGEYEFKPKAEREYMFDHMWKQVKEKFYDPGLHGVDWDYYKENYSKFLPYINNYFDFQELLSEILGELNASHTGGRYRYSSGLTMGTLGVIYDSEYKGDGLKIKEILPNGSLSLAYPDVKPGDIVSAIEGVEIKAGEDWYKLMTDRAGKKTHITLLKNGKKPVELYMKPGHSDVGLLYKRWVKQREEKVRELSGGKVGYVHVRGMNSESFREVFSKALGKYRTAEALIVDTRHNGGGWLHDDLITFLSGKEYVHYQPQGNFIGKDPFTKWTRPSCVLMGEDNYSDACGFPYAYKSLGIGKLIGAPVAGTMTAVWWETQINANIIFGIPQVGTWCIKEGHYSENHQVEPDILILNDPASVLRGDDKQLEAAVKEMLKTISD